MDGAQRKNDWSLQELESLVRQKRRALARGQSDRFLAAEVELRRQLASQPEDLTKPPKSPESWRGANDRDRYFRSMTVVPLDESQHWLLPDKRQADTLGAVVTIQETSRTTGQRIRDTVLLLVEILAVVGLLVAVGLSYLHLRTLNREANQQQMASTPTQAALAIVSEPTQATPTAMLPTATISPTSLPATARPTQAAPTEAAPTEAATAVLLLPGSRPTLRSTPGEQAPTADQTPPLLNTLATVRAREDTPTAPAEPATTTSPIAPTATPTPEVARRLVIPKIQVDNPIIAGDSWEDLKQGIGHRLGSANPGETGNAVLSAHNDVYGEIFRHLNKLEPGDEVFAAWDGVLYRYVVTRVEIVSPTRVEFMDPTDYPALTLITCYPYLIDTHRVVVVAELTGQVDRISSYEE
ncbi:MAG: sortase [Chloroflexi bacterium]|jgi:LPXTG-site transpeptidase (sortase) family protein|nr:sortase [Chloroflexota bacterium]